MAKRRIYLDHNATTPLHPEVKKEMQGAMEIFGNPSSMHSFGREAKMLVDGSREKVAFFIGADPEEITFMGSGSEANNTVLSTVTCRAIKCNCGTKQTASIVTTKIEHPCILESSKCLSDRGVQVAYLDVDRQGKVNLDQLANVVTENTRIVSVMMANNEIGTIQDIKEITRIVHEQGALMHTDAVQAVGKLSVNVNELGVDFLSLSAHKIYGPKGVGALYIRKGTPFCALIHGGHQERGRRAGTENTLGIIGLAKAIEMRQREMVAEAKRLLQFKNVLCDAFKEKISDISFNGHPVDSLTGTLNVSFAGAEGEAILLYLDLEGIAVSTGSACASGSLDPSHVILATGIPAEQAHGSIRISMGRETTESDIEYLIEMMPKVINKVRKISTVY